MKRQDINILCEDGFYLAGSLYKPKELKAAVIIGPATGIKRQFYHSIAEYLSEYNYGVITYDNRGIGGSKKGSINDIDASLINWGRLDMSAVLRHLQSTFPNKAYHLIGHSAGGQLVGLMDNAHDLRSMFNVASSSGSLKNMTYPFKFTANFFLNFFIPFSNLLFGKTKSEWVGMGETLPKLVAQQWRKWCNGKAYVATDFGNAIQKHHYDDLNFPTCWLHATDDGIANLANVKDMIQIFTKAPSRIITLNPSQHGISQLGHMDFFRSKNKALWSHVLAWLDQHN